MALISEKRFTLSELPRLTLLMLPMKFVSIMIEIRLISDYNRSRNDGESGVRSLQNQKKVFSSH